MKTEKDWADALHEQCFPEEVSPPEGSWTGITGKMRRRAVYRKAAATALAILVPLGAVLLFGPCQTTPDDVAELEQPATGQIPGLLSWQGEEPDYPAVREDHYRPSRISDMVMVKSEETPASVAPEPPVISPQDSCKAPSNETASPVNITVKPTSTTPSKDYFTEYSDETEQPAIRKKRLSVNLHASGAAGRLESNRIAAYPSGKVIQSKSSETDFYNMVSIVEQVPIYYRHDVPLSLGLTLSWELSPHIALESGLTYTYLHSHENVLGDQRLHFVGIPLKLTVRLLSAGPIEVGAGGYGMAEKCVSAAQGRLSVKEPGLQWSSGAFIDAGYRLGNNVSLYMQPSMSYYFTKTNLLTYRTENPLGFSLQAGIRFHL